MDQFSFSSAFKFNVRDWRNVVVDCVQPPPHADVRLYVDPAYSSNHASSDQSAVAASFVDDEGTLVILDAAAGWWKGIELPRQITAVAHKWNVNEIRIERNGTGAPDLLIDTVNLLAGEQGITLGRISSFNPNNCHAAKRRRVYRLQSLLDMDPPRLKLRQSAYISQLLEQVVNFCFDVEDNHAREDGLLDVISMSFR